MDKITKQENYNKFANDEFSIYDYMKEGINKFKYD